eukprot:253542-Prorocentrum_minimum.AAC.1
MEFPALVLVRSRVERTRTLRAPEDGMGADVDGTGGNADDWSVVTAPARMARRRFGAIPKETGC